MSLDMLILCFTTPGAACDDVFDLVFIQGALKQQQQQQSGGWLGREGGKSFFPTMSLLPKEICV